MVEETDSHKRNDTWILTALPPEKMAIKSKWVFKTKTNSNGEIMRHKAILVVQGFSQQKGIDYIETFASVARYTSIRFSFANTD